MKKLLTVISLSTTLFSGTAFAASGTGTATAEVLPRPITVTITQEPNFGKFQVGSSGGSTNGFAVTGDVVMIDSSQSQILHVDFSGEPNTNFNYDVPAATLTEAGGANMTTTSIATASHSFSAAGTAGVGAGNFHLNVSGGQKAALYTGTVTVNANY